jgi:hypothetical protein
VLGSAVADENVDEFALGFGDDALVLLFRDLQNKEREKAALLAETKGEAVDRKRQKEQKPNQTRLFCLVVRYGADRLAAACAYASCPSRTLFRLQKFHQSIQLRRAR